MVQKTHLVRRKRWATLQSQSKQAGLCSLQGFLQTSFSDVRDGGSIEGRRHVMLSIMVLKQASFLFKFERAGGIGQQQQRPFLKGGVAGMSAKVEGLGESWSVYISVTVGGGKGEM